MSQENLEIVRCIYDRWAEGDFQAGRELLDPGITTVWAQDFPTAGTYHGPEGHAAAMREWLSAWTDLTLEAERFVDAGESVVVPFVVRARGRESGAEVERRWAHVWTLHDGRVVRFEVHLEIREALEAVGLAEQAMSANLDLVRSIFADWERGDYSRAEWAHPEIELVIADGPSPGTWTGLAGMGEGWSGFLTAWEGHRSHAESYRDLGSNRILVLARGTGRAKRSGLEFAEGMVKSAAVFHVRDGMVTGLVVYLHRDRALADLGIEE